MPTEFCECCGNSYDWIWEEAFYKFGFNDGAMGYLSEEVADVLRNSTLKLKVSVEPQALHNAMVVSIKSGTTELIPHDKPKFRLGQDCPREYLSDEIVALLDQELNPVIGQAA